MKNNQDFSLYLVTQRSALSQEEFFHTIFQSIKGGVKVVQLREKTAPIREMCALGRALLTLLKPLGIPLIINDRVDVAHAIQAQGVHLGQSDLSVADARKILGPQSIIGLSVETMEQAKAAAALEVNYLAASPVFVTNTKDTEGNCWGLQGLKQLCTSSPHPIVAIGGIHEGNVKEVMECGAQGIAVVSAIFNAPCAKTAAGNLIHRMGRYSII